VQGTESFRLGVEPLQERLLSLLELSQEHLQLRDRLGRRLQLERLTPRPVQLTVETGYNRRRCGVITMFEQPSADSAALIL
jgi:hypothetical protein